MSAPTPLKVLETLKQARSLIAAGWTKRAAARTAEGEPCAPWDDKAVSFCFYGAPQRACGLNDDVFKLIDTPEEQLFQAVCRQLTGDDYHVDFVKLNDRSHTSEPVLARYDSAIAQLERELTF